MPCHTFVEVVAVLGLGLVIRVRFGVIIIAYTCVWCIMMVAILDVIDGRSHNAATWGVRFV